MTSKSATAASALALVTAPVAALLVAGVPAAAADTPPSKGPWVKPEQSSLRKVFGLRHAKSLAEPKLLESSPEQWTEPFISLDGGLVFVATGAGALHAFWTESGAELWHRFGVGSVGRAFAQHSDTLLAGIGVDLVGIEGFSGVEQWRVDLGAPVGGEATISGKLAIVPVRPNAYAAVDLEAHKILWRFKRPVAEGITVRGQARATVDRRAGRVYVGFSDGAVAALSLADGSGIWLVALGNSSKPFADVDTSPQLLDRNRALVVASYNGGAALLEAATGRILARNSELMHLTGLTSIPNEPLMVASHGDGEVLGVDPEKLAVRWRYRLDKGVPTTPRSLGHGLVVVGASEGPAAILEAATGKPIQLITPGSGISARPAARNDHLAIFSNGGLLTVSSYGRGTGTTR